MALTPSDLLGTPPEYATPDQLAGVQEYARLLMQGGQRDQPITSPWQGVRMMTDALSANIMRNRLGQQQQQGYDAGARARVGPGIPGSDQSSISQSFDIGLPPPTASPTGGGPASVRNNNPGAQWPGPIASQYGATGSQTIGGGNKIATFPDPVSGAAAEFALLEKRYSGMPLGSAVAKWSGGNSSPAYTQFIAKRTGLTPDTVISPQLLRSPQGVALAKAMADWEAGGQSALGPQDWARAQQRAFGGQGAAQAAGGQTADVSGRIGWGGPPGGGVPGVSATPMGAGPPAANTPPPTPGSPAAMSGALAGNTGAPAGQQVAAGPKAVPGEPGPPTVGAPNMGPGFMWQRPQISKQQMFEILRNPWIDGGVKEQYYQQYIEQNQPVTAPGTGGTWVMSRDGKMTFVPTPQKMKQGETEYETQHDPSGGLHVVPPAYPTAPAGPVPTPPDILKRFTPGTTGPQSSAPVPPGGPAVSQAGGQPPSSMMNSPPPGGAKPIQLASLTPGVPSPNTSPVGPQPNVGPQAPPTGAGTPPPGPQTAQAGGQIPQGPLGPFINDLTQWQSDVNATREGAATTSKKLAEAAEEERQGMNDAARKSEAQMSGLQTALKLVDDPNFVSGIINTPGTLLEKAKALMGNNPNAARAIETFDKIIAGATLPEVTSQTKGVGQVRLAEFYTVKESLANRNLTPEGIKSVLGIMLRAHQQNIDVSELASAFSQGWRIAPDGKPYKTGKFGLNDPEWQPTLNRYLEQNPVITPELRANWEKNFGSNLDEAAARWQAEKNARDAGQGTTSSGRPQPQAPTGRTGRPQPQGTVPPPPAGYR